MKPYFFYLVAFTALLSTGCRKIEADGEKEIVIINGPGNGNGTGQTITLQGRINADTLLKKENTYILKGLVYLVGNHTMTIQPGTVIKASYSGTDVAALVITRGSKIMAQGSANEPIVFTSASPNPQAAVLDVFVCWSSAACIDQDALGPAHDHGVIDGKRRISPDLCSCAKITAAHIA